MGKWEHLAMSLLNEGKTNMAAEAFEEARMPLRAAEIYEKVENFQKAGELYKTGQDAARAAVAFEKAYSHHKMFMKEKPEIALEAARLYREVGATADAGRLFAMAGDYGQAAAAYEEAGQHKDAGEYFYRAREYDRAVESFERAGDRVRSALVRAEKLEGEGQLGEAARYYKTGNNLIKAGELFDASDSPSEAAECYAATGAYAEAAECYARAGEKGPAADMFQRAGNYQRAAELYLEAGEMDKAISNFEQGGRNYDAGLLLSQMGRSAPAIASLRRVPADSDRYRETNYLLGNLLRKNDLLSEAVEAYQRAAAGHPVVTNTLDLYYNLADALQAIGRTAEAEVIFREIETIKPDFRDVKQRAVGST
ncbi:MAG: hypothetical protein ACWGSD_16370 [Thermodesulfobacteriota bacterium]